MEDFLSVREAARRLDVHTQTIYRLIWDGQIGGAVRVGRAIRIPARELSALPHYSPPVPEK